MWSHESDVEEEWFVRISFFNETYRLISKLGAGKSLGLAFLSQLPIAKVLYLEVTVISHATHVNRTPLGEAHLQGIEPIVPLTDDEGVITGLTS